MAKSRARNTTVARAGLPPKDKFWIDAIGYDYIHAGFFLVFVTAEWRDFPVATSAMSTWQ
jgi:hypothetical protein